MSVVPEFVFQTTISRGIQLLREDSRYIDQLFRNLSHGDQEQMRIFLQSNQIDLSMNMPRSQLKLPALVVLLKAEDESPQGAYLDDFKGIGTPSEFAYDGDYAEVLGGVASVTNTSGPGAVLFGPWMVLSATLNTLTVSDRTFYSEQFMDGSERNTVHIVQGTGAGQQREIIANSHNTLMVSKNWLTTPDATSAFEVRAPTEEVLGQPAKLYDNRDSSLTLERKGGLYLNKYTIQIVGQNQEQVIYLYAILKSIFLLSRIFMEKQGLINMRLSGTDFVSRPEYIPDFAYMREMKIEFEGSFDVYVPLSGLVEDFTLCLNEGTEGANAQVSNASVDLTAATPVIPGP